MPRQGYMGRPGTKALSRLAGAVLLASLGVGCSIGEDLHRGYYLDERALAQVKPGIGPEQVLQILGTPSTVSTVGNKSWYYISQVSTRRLQFLGESVSDQRVTAVYFTPGFKVERVALYGMQDGVVFDFISRRTEAGGNEASFITQLFRGLSTFVPKT